MQLGRSRFLALAVLCMALTPVLAACSISGAISTTTNQFKVGIVTDVAGAQDRGENSLAVAGVQQAIRDFGIVGNYTESTSPEDYVPNLSAFASQGYNLVIAVGFLMQPALGTAAAEFPNTHFVIVDGHATDANLHILNRPNVESLLFKEEDIGALAGVVAGVMEKDGATPKKTNVISVVGTTKSATTDRYIAGYQWGARLEDPSVQVLDDYSNAISDPNKCQDVANKQIGNGSEILFDIAGSCGLGTLAAANQHGVYSITSNTDESFNPSIVASAVKGVDVAVYGTIKDALAGRFKSGDVMFGIQNDGVRLDPGSRAFSPDIVNRVEQIIEELKSGTQTIPSSL